MFRNLLSVFIVLVLLLPGSLFDLIVSQTGSANELRAQNTANKTYRKLGFKQAIAEFEKRDKLSTAEMIKVANAYRLNADWESAAFWYAQVVEESQEPIHYFYYAQAQQSNGNLAEAKKYYLRYEELVGGENGVRAHELAAAIDRMNELTPAVQVEVKNEGLINSERLDFSPSYYNNGIVFVSTRKSGSASNNLKDRWMDDNFMTLFQAKMDGGKLAAPTEFAEHLETKFHEGPVSFTRSGDRIFFTRNQFNKGKRKNDKQGVMKLNIYTATKEGQDWSEAIELPFNTSEHEEAHPALSPDSRKLYFASDRPGGFGGMDLYVSEYQRGGWSEPRNLGAVINTQGNEVFPFMHDDGTLYFASNGLPGLGGLDIFSTTTGSDTTWAAPKNLGKPFNSNEDDFGFVMDVPGTEGYFTSARDGGYGKDDIYSFKTGDAILNSANAVVASICGFDESLQERIGNVNFSIKEIKSEGSNEDIAANYAMEIPKGLGDKRYLLNPQGASLGATNRLGFNSGKSGQFRIELLPGTKYELIATKEGYELSRKELQTNNEGSIDLCLPLTRNVTADFKGTLKDARNYALSGAEIILLNKCNDRKSTVKTGSDGSFNFSDLPCDCDFEVFASQNGQEQKINAFSTKGPNCGILDPGTNNVLTEDIVMPSNSYTGTSNTHTDLAVGAVIELKNLYYDFDKYYIRDDAARELDKVVHFMQQYPSMILELSSHTDARGGDVYNQSLSQKRANAAVLYITSRGIARSRLMPRGHGETWPRNQCRDGTYCSEEEYQYNRRTEIKITQMNEKVQVNYIDNAPEVVDRAYD